MNQMNMRKMVLGGSIAGAVLMMAGAYAAAQTSLSSAPTATTDANLAQQQAAATTSTTSTKPKTSTPAMVLEACQRTQARFAKFLANGTPEQFGSEEPFTFDPNKKCP
jgi:hypothetical protein